MDSYEKFLKDFNITPQALFEWGIQNTIFPNPDKVDEAWKKLLFRIANGEKVYIRGYGRDSHATKLYFDFYKFVFGNITVVQDPTNNMKPNRNIQMLTGLKRNKNIYNYQVSHIFGKTKNVFLFEAPWNVAYVPKLMDPFTGHEAKGEYPKEYQKYFVGEAAKRYSRYITEYNELVKHMNISDKITDFVASIRGSVDKKQLEQFEADCRNEFAPLVF